MNISSIGLRTAALTNIRLISSLEIVVYALSSTRQPFIWKSGLCGRNFDRGDEKQHQIIDNGVFRIIKYVYI